MRCPQLLLHKHEQSMREDGTLHTIAPQRLSWQTGMYTHAFRAMTHNTSTSIPADEQEATAVIANLIRVLQLE